MKIKTPLYPVMLLVLSGCTEARVHGQSYPRDSRVDAIFAEYEEPGSPGAVAMVVKDGSILHAAAYGLANLETGDPLTLETPLRLASVSKQFFTMGVMLLAERDSLDYDDPVVRWIPEMNRFPGVTIRNLMNHTGGIPDYYDEVLRLDPQLDDDPLITNAEAATVYETWGEAQFNPGDKFEYSNSGYEILALIIQRISGQSIKNFMRENVFEPAGMATAAVQDRRDIRIPNSAVGYSRSEVDSLWVENDDSILNGLVGAGGIYASLLDMYAWDKALYSGGVVSPERLEEAFQPTELNDGTIIEYGFGWNSSVRNGHRCVAHAGGWVGFRTIIDRYVDESLTVIVLTNSTGDIDRFRNEVAMVFLPGQE